MQVDHATREGELKEWTRENLGWLVMPDEAWRLLREFPFGSDLISDRYENDAEGERDRREDRKSFLGHVQRAVGLAHFLPEEAFRAPAGRGSEIPTVLAQADVHQDDSSIDDYERERADAMSIAVAQIANRLPRVRAFRRHAFGDDQLLSPNQAASFLASPALAFLHRKSLSDAQVPLVGHQAHVVHMGEARRADGAIRLAVAVSVAASDSENPTVLWRQAGQNTMTTINAPRQRGLDPMSFVDELSKLDLKKLKAEFGGELGQKKYENELRRARRRRIRTAEPSQYMFPGPVRVWKLSVLHQLGELALWLAKRMMWDEPDAIWFVLTGEAPRIPAVRATHRAIGQGTFERAEVTLQVQPWVSPKTVARVYQEHQKAISPRRQRANQKQVKVFRFVEGLRDERGLKPKVQEQAAAWDAAHADDPEQQYGSHAQNISRDYGRAKQALLFPYGWSKKLGG